MEAVRVHRSTDKGEHWTDISPDSANNAITALVVSNNNLFAATDGAMECTYPEMMVQTGLR